MPILRDLNFRILIPAIMMETAKASFSNQTPSVIQYSKIIKAPTKNETISKYLIFHSTLFFKDGDFMSHNISDIHIVTPIIPITLPTTFRLIEIMVGMKYARTDPMINNKLNTIINGSFTLMPNPS